ncbi:MAG: hypothetical protein LBP35_03360 [Candidatus Ancillula trichonymphae]|jgi:hypothetical protein|nr:hypothetical protein [Candidatus Ancillula trichonymphae]
MATQKSDGKLKVWGDNTGCKITSTASTRRACYLNQNENQQNSEPSSLTTPTDVLITPTASNVPEPALPIKKFAISRNGFYFLDNDDKFYTVGPNELDESATGNSKMPEDDNFMATVDLKGSRILSVSAFENTAYLIVDKLLEPSKDNGVDEIKNSKTLYSLGGTQDSKVQNNHPLLEIATVQDPADDQSKRLDEVANALGSKIKQVVLMHNKPTGVAFLEDNKIFEFNLVQRCSATANFSQGLGQDARSSENALW